LTSNKELFEADLRAFLQCVWRDSIAAKIRKQCRAAAAAVSSPIIPCSPELVRLASDLLPKNEEFSKEFYQKRTDISAPSQLLDQAIQKIAFLAHFKKPARADSVPEAEVKSFEWLKTPKDKMNLIELLAPVLTSQDNANTVVRSKTMNQTSEMEVSSVNNVYLLNVRSVVIMFCIQALLLLPKTYHAYTEPSFLTTRLADQFFLFLNQKNQKTNVSNGLESSFFALTDGDKPLTPESARKDHKLPSWLSNPPPTDKEIKQSVARYGLNSAKERIKEKMATLDTENKKLTIISENLSRYCKYLKEHPETMVT